MAFAAKFHKSFEIIFFLQASPSGKSNVSDPIRRKKLGKKKPDRSRRKDYAGYSEQ